MTLTPPSSRGGSVLSSTTELTAAQVRALFTTPVTLIPAPGAGIAIWPLTQFISYTFATRPYASTQVSTSVFDTQTAAAISVVNIGVSVSFVSVQASYAVTGADGYANLPLKVFAGASLAGGPVVTTTKAAGGADYAVGDTGVIDAGDTLAAYVVDTVSAGAVVTYHLTAAGTNYEVANNVATVAGGGQPGIGTGFTVNVTAVAPADGTLKIATLYQLLTL